jgi:hypothetical protein
MPQVVSNARRRPFSLVAAPALAATADGPDPALAESSE